MIRNHRSLVLAFLGDSVLELKIREYYVRSGLMKVKDLQNMTSQLASASAHHQIMDYLLENDLLSSEELKVYKKGRNAKVNQRRKNFDSENYHASTGFEALIGYLYLNNKDRRIDELVKLVIEKFEK